jgi:hypothetical protein
MKKKKLRKQVKSLRSLIKGIWLHANLRYAYEQMTTDEKKLYCDVIGEDYEKFNKEFFEAGDTPTGGPCSPWTTTTEGPGSSNCI